MRKLKLNTPLADSESKQPNDQGIRMFTARSKYTAFTLAELLIALAILGVIATFTIPKIIVAQQVQKNNAITKEAISTIAGAYKLYTMNNSVTTTFTLTDLMPYLNYAKIDTSSDIDTLYSFTGSIPCSGGTCIKLHSGATILHWSNTFPSTTNLSAIGFQIDPDGQLSNPSTTDGFGKSMFVYLYPNGRIVDGGNTQVGTVSDGGAVLPHPEFIPPWFNWSQ